MILKTSLYSIKRFNLKSFKKNVFLTVHVTLLG